MIVWSKSRGRQIALKQICYLHLKPSTMDTFFKLKENNASIQQKLLLYFFVSGHVLYHFVNPSILSQGVPFSSVLTATILVAFFSSLVMGVYAGNPMVSKLERFKVGNR
jgi:xanthine/uracil/vitamin C permease (AzgA family)